jgi:hypothetical protein
MPAVPPNSLLFQSRPIAPRLRKAALIVMAACGALSLFMIASNALLIWVNKSPFQMVIEPRGDHAVVQFMQPDDGLISQTFPVELRLENRQEIVLSSEAATIPGGRIEFADMTILPGHFRIRIGTALFDVMVRGIEVDGQHFEWLYGE